MNLIIGVCRALANKTRLHLLRLIHEQPGSTVQTLASTVPVHPSEISKHLRILRGYQLIRMIPKGRYVQCSPPLETSTKSPFLREMQTLLKDLFVPQELNCTLAQVCNSAEISPEGWETVYRAMVGDATAFTHLRRLLILRWLAQHGPSHGHSISVGIGISPAALTRHLDKLQRRGVIANALGERGLWVVACPPNPPARARLLAIIMRTIS